MTTPFLPVFHDNAAGDAEELLEHILTKPFTFSNLTACTMQYRIKGISTFLMMADTYGIKKDLMKGIVLFAENYTKTIDIPVLSRLEVLWDAISINELKIAKTIAQLSSTAFNFDKEYEEDYLYFKYICNKFFSDENNFDAIISRFAELNSDDSRYSIISAFQANDEHLFREALEMRIEEFESEWRGRRDRGVVSDEDFFTSGQIFLEGMALIRLGEMLGMNCRMNYRYIPSILFAIDNEVLTAVNWKNPWE